MRGDNQRGFQSPDKSFGRSHPRTNGANGVHPEGMRSRPIPIGEAADPVDLVAVQADDELINALAAGVAVSAPGVGGYDSDDHVAAVLAAWKAEVDLEPIPELLDVDTAVRAVLAARPASPRMRHLAPVAAAAAFLVFAIGGVSVGSYSSEPGDALWAVSKVLYSERAESVEAAANVETHITRAKQAIAQGQPDVAALELELAAAELASVRPEEGQTVLAEVQDFLVAKAEEAVPGVPTDPGAPLVGDSERPVPAGAAIEVSPTELPIPSSIEFPVTSAPDPVRVPPASSVDPVPDSSEPDPTLETPTPTVAPDPEEDQGDPPTADPTDGPTSPPVTSENGPVTSPTQGDAIGGANGAGDGVPAVDQVPVATSTS